jgi:antimicrobial peptide system SdpA family protein
MDLLKARITFFCSIFFTAGIIFYFISIYFGNNPLNRRLKSKTKLISIFPEGWAFFTKKSSDPRVYIFKVESDKISEVNLRNFSAEYLYGLSRNNRLLNIQFCNILKKVCTDSLPYFEMKASDPKKIKELIIASINFNDVKLDRKLVPQIRGRYLLAIQKMLPWPLIHKEPSYPSNYSIYPVNVYCNE